MLRVRDFMTREVITLGPDESAGQALRLCRSNDIRHLPIIDEGNLVGIVSDRDSRDVSPPRGTAEEDTLSRVRVRDIMSTDLITVHPLETIDRAAHEIIGAFGVGSWVEVEVPNEPGALAGVTDIIRNRRINIASIFLASAQRSPYRVHAIDHRTAVLRLESSDPSGIVRTLEDTGLRATAVKPYVPRGPPSKNRREEGTWS